MSGPTTTCDRCGQLFLFALEDHERLLTVRKLRSYGVLLATSLVCSGCAGELLQQARRDRLLSPRRGVPKRTP